MNKTYLVGLMTMVVALAGCSNPPVSVKGERYRNNGSEYPY